MLPTRGSVARELPDRVARRRRRGATSTGRGEEFASPRAMCLCIRPSGATAPETDRDRRMAVERGDAAFVAFEHVQKSYDGETLVVKDLNLGIGKGEFLTMLGPSGSGKTTCLMMLAGFETATHGEITPRRPADQQHPAAQARHRHGVPELRAVPAHDGRREPRLPAAGAQDGQGRRSTPRSPAPSTWCRWAASPAAARRSSPAASSSASRSPARWSSSPSSC